LFNGYQKSFELEENAIPKTMRPQVRNVFPLINKTIYCKSPDFKAKKWFSKQLQVIPHEPNPVSWRRMEMLKANNGWGDREVRLFTLSRHSYNPDNADWRQTYVFRYPEWLKSVIKESFITHVKIFDHEVHARLGELRNHMDRLNLWHKIDRARSHGGYHDYGYDVNINDLKGQAASKDAYKEWLFSGFEEPFTDPTYKYGI